MRIAIFSDTFLPEVNGVVSALMLQLRELDRMGYEVLLVIPKSYREDSESLFENVQLLEVPSVPALVYPQTRLGIPVSYTAFKSILDFNPDVIHYYTEYAMGLAGITMARLLKKPLVGSFHTYYMDPTYLTMLGVRKGKGLVSKLLQKEAVFFHSGCNLLLVPSHVVRKDVLSWGYSGRVEVLPYPVEVPSIRHSDEEITLLRTSLGLGEMKVILYVGRLSKEKSLSVLLEAFSRVSISESRLLLIGEGPELDNLQHLARSLGINSRVCFLGKVAHDVLLRDGYYALADCFATASASETSGISVIEALGYGLPVAGVAAGGVEELLSNGVGFLAEPDDVDGLANILIDILSLGEKQRSIVAAKAKESVKIHEPIYVATQLCNRYGELLL